MEGEEGEKKEGEDEGQKGEEKGGGGRKERERNGGEENGKRKKERRKDVWKDRKEEGEVHALLGEYKHVVEY